MKEAFSLGGKVALVIGGTSGIGRGGAGGLLESGAGVVVAGRTPGKLARAVEELKTIGDAHGSAADVRDLDALRGLVAAALAHHGRIDILVNAQGITTLKPAEEFTAADWDEIMLTNLRSVFFACTEAG